MNCQKIVILLLSIQYIPFFNLLLFPIKYYILENFVIGVNHHKINAENRSKYSLNYEQQVQLYDLIKSLGSAYCAIVNTCNRTEIYGSGSVEYVKNAYIEVLGANFSSTNTLNVMHGHEAIAHIFNVTCGLDSQVIGDLEILGQVKSAFQAAKQHHALNGFMERLANTAIQAAKEVRSKTNLSSGTVSLSYAAIKYIKRIHQTQPINVLLVGTGEFGKRIANNIKDYLPNANLTLCNRTALKAEELASKLGCKIHSFEKLTDAIAANDVIISSVNDAGSYLINNLNVPVATLQNKVFIDMSIPFSIDPKLALTGCTLVNIDEISKEINQTIELRNKDIPVAMGIIDRYVQEFISWAEIFEKSESIQQWKQMMLELSHTCPHLSQMAEEHKNRVVGKSIADFAMYVKQRSNLPKETEQIIHHFLTESYKAVACKKATIKNEPVQIHNCSACQSR
jgi:glutamyl-tRNA reductase